MSKNTNTTVPSVTVESLVATYADAKGGDRTKLRNEWNVAMRDAMRAGDLSLSLIHI